ncbi:uncharacterized protein AKAW2_50229A [Aspergillus luchuensis]|uniref:Uncharacterized protein n=1 Tax=Aspergillus kawachii TaxID=1069201 RepID=A0A7R8A0K3_ASPKA|nr:uncharacterized protein AKAW2_50229A [Aspergillus luchuensis]BCR99887.1 hypothetical protein AKAW2_50229A [Aspergillus luchuensis]
MATWREGPTVDRIFVINGANEGDPIFGQCDNLSRNLEDDDVPPIQRTIAAVPFLLTTRCDSKSVLESSGLPPEPDHFIIEMLRLLSLYSADTSRYRYFRHHVRRKGAVLVRLQLKIMRQCVSEGLRASHGSMTDTEFVHLVLRRHPYYGQTTVAAALLRHLIPGLPRCLAKANCRGLLNIVTTVTKHWVTQKDLS